jgi:tripartite-type tricarboxylate transporter receptor subunit TctC
MPATTKGRDGFNMSGRWASIAGVIVLAALLLMPVVARAQIDPDHPVRLILPFGPGGVADVTARIVTEKLGEKLGQRFIIENIPGAGGINAARAVPSSPADGYTLALLSNGTAISVSLFKNLSFNPVTDFVPVSSLGYFDFIFVTKAGSPYSTLALSSRQRSCARRAQCRHHHCGLDAEPLAQLFKSTAGVDVTIVPFRSSPDVLIALLRSDIQMAIENYTAVQSHIADKAVIAVASSGRSAPFPAVGFVGEGVVCRRFRAVVVECDLRAEGHAAGSDQDAQRRAARGARDAGTEEARARTRHRGQGQHTGGNPRAAEGRYREMG